MRDHITRKKSPVCTKNPVGVGQPSLAISTQPPKNFCISLYVSGFAIKKKTNVVYAAYFALRAILGGIYVLSGEGIYP